MEIEGYKVFVADGSGDELNESMEKKKGRGRPKKGEEPVQKKGKKDDSSKDKTEKQAVKKNRVWPHNNLTKNAGSITYINYSDESTSDSNSQSEYESESGGSSSGIDTPRDSDKSDFETTFRPGKFGLKKKPTDLHKKERKNAVKKKESHEKPPKFYELNFTDTSESDTSSEEGGSFSEYSDDGEEQVKKTYKFNDEGAYDVKVSKAKKGKASSTKKSYGKRPSQLQRKSRPKKPLLDNSSSDDETDEDDVQPLYKHSKIPGRKRIFIDEEHGSGDNEDGEENSSQATKGRGRPPKKASGKSSPAKDAGAKKGRGRPKKNMIESSSDDDEKEKDKIEA